MYAAMDVVELEVRDKNESLASQIVNKVIETPCEVVGITNSTRDIVEKNRAFADMMLTAPIYVGKSVATPAINVSCTPDGDRMVITACKWGHYIKLLRTKEVIAAYCKHAI